MLTETEKNKPVIAYSFPKLKVTLWLPEKDKQYYNIQNYTGQLGFLLHTLCDIFDY